MSNDNGSGRILLHNRRPMGKSGDFVTRAELEQLVMAETSKVHEYYLNQIPKFTAQMIQDALVSYGLLTLTPPPDLAAGDGPDDDPVHTDTNAPVVVPEAPEVPQNTAPYQAEFDNIAPVSDSDYTAGSAHAGVPCGTEPIGSIEGGEQSAVAHDSDTSAAVARYDAPSDLDSR